MNKNRHIIGELQEFFANNDSSKAINSISTIMNDGNVNWRRIIYSVFRQLYSRVSRKTTSKSDVKCVIIDDTDLPKIGFKTEKIDKVFSHTQMKPILGFKAMFLCFTDGVSQFLLDFSLHGEEGQRSDKPQGLSKKQAEARYCKERSEDERIAKRSAEYLASKIETAISMLKRSIIDCRRNHISGKTTVLIR